MLPNDPTILTCDLPPTVTPGTPGSPGIPGIHGRPRRGNSDQLLISAARSSFRRRPVKQAA